MGKFISTSTVSAALLLLTLISTTAYCELKPYATIYVNENGVAIVNITVGASQGVNTASLPVKPLEPTIEVRCDGYEAPWVLANDTQLHFYTEDVCSAAVSYVANTSIQGGVLTMEVVGGGPVKLALASNIVLLTLPQSVAAVARESNLLAIVFTAPATIAYTVLTEPTTTEPTKGPTTTIPTQAASPTPVPTTKPTTPTQTTTLIQTTETATPAQAVEQTKTLKPPAIAVIGIAIAATAVTITVLLKRRGVLKQHTRT